MYLVVDPQSSLRDTQRGLKRHLDLSVFAAARPGGTVIRLSRL